jgi:hypothetical protein
MKKRRGVVEVAEPLVRLRGYVLVVIYGERVVIVNALAIDAAGSPQLLNNRGERAVTRAYILAR